MSRSYLLLILGFVLVVVGIAVILIAAVLNNGSSGSGGVVIFVGPFPIVIGTASDVSWIVLFTIVLAILNIVVFLVMKRKISKFES